MIYELNVKSAMDLSLSARQSLLSICCWSFFFWKSSSFWFWRVAKGRLLTVTL